MSTVTINLKSENRTIARALNILESRMIRYDVLTNPETSANYLRLKLADLKDEVFACLFLDTRNRIISFETLFTGTINGASVHPRVVIRKALELNAAAVIFAHNHPSGMAEPSQADKTLTNRLKDACELVDIRVLDHFVVSHGESVSFAERGLI